MFDLNLDLNVRNWSLNARSRRNYDVYMFRSVVCVISELLGAEILIFG